MAGPKPTKPPIPLWAWPFAAACIAIPIVAIGGAIPTAIGAGGAFYCIAVARKAGKTTRRKLVHCVAVSAACWVLFLAVAGGVALIQNRFPGLTNSEHFHTQKADPSGIGEQTPDRQEIVLNDEAQRREIYAKAVRMRKHLELAVARREERRERGLDTEVSDKQIEHIKGMHEKRLEFMTRFYRISRQQLDDIIAEGDRKRWPTE
jgi:hypothetical protein